MSEPTLHSGGLLVIYFFALRISYVHSLMSNLSQSTPVKHIELKEGFKVYFASDFHLGAPNTATSRERELRLVRWLDTIVDDTQELFILGDVFDFWYEYNHLAPKGYVRLLAKIAEFTDAGIPVTFFKGNHDMWMKDYLPQEIGVKILDDTLSLHVNDKRFLIGHGDGLGPGDHTYKFLRAIFRSKWAQWLFTRVHPNFSFWVAQSWSSNSRLYNDKDRMHLGDKEMIYQYCLAREKTDPADYYIFGHRHLPMTMNVGDSAIYVNLGEWINYSTYGVFDGKEFALKEFSDL